MAFTSLFLVRKSVIILVVTNLVICMTHASDDSDGHQSRSYFDELSRISQYKQVSDKTDGFSFSQAYLEDMSYDLGISSDHNLIDGTSDNNKERRLLGKYSVNKVLHVLKEYLDDRNANSNSTNSTCAKDTGRLVTSLLSVEPWALQFLDAMGKPGPSLSRFWITFTGNYDQCRAALAPPSSNTTRDGFKGNYCVLTDYLKVGKSLFPFPATLGTCFPSTCTAAEVTELMYEIASVANISLGGASAQCLEGKTKVTTATVFAILVLSITGCLALLGTFYDFVCVQGQEKNIAPTVSLEVNRADPRTSDHVVAGNDRNYEPVNASEAAPLIKKQSINDEKSKRGLTAKILLAFSVYTNGKKVLDTSQQSGSLGSIHGIRFLSMSWVVLGHCYAFGPAYAINMLDGEKESLGRWTFDAITNALVSVDTFFALSGLLTSYLTIKELKRKGLCINWLKFYFHRFWRLTPPYMLALVFFLGLTQYLGQGPLWRNEQPNDKTFCEKNWWTNLLYVNNFVNPKEMCFGHSWYLANDMQFFIISPFMLIPFYFHWILGVASCTLFLLASWITTGVLSMHYGWGVSILSAMEGDWFDKYYILPWCRIGPYVVGILAGYLLVETNGKPFRMRWWVVAVGWIAAIASALAVVYGIHDVIDGENRLSNSVAALYNVVGRSVWGACVCWVIIACNAGYGGPVNVLLSWSPFVALGRLTYMTYLIHLPLIYIFFQNFGMPFYLNDPTMAILFIGILVFSNMAAFVLMLLFESPMIGLEKAFLRKA